MNNYKRVENEAYVKKGTCLPAVYIGFDTYYKYGRLAQVIFICPALTFYSASLCHSLQPQNNMQRSGDVRMYIHFCPIVLIKVQVSDTTMMSKEPMPATKKYHHKKSDLKRYP